MGSQEEDDALMAELYGTPLPVPAGAPTASTNAVPPANRLAVGMISLVLFVAPWREDAHISPFANVYGRPLCAARRLPCNARVPFELDARVAAAPDSLQRAGAESMEQNGVAVIRGAVDPASLALLREQLEEKLPQLQIPYGILPEPGREKDTLAFAPPIKSPGNRVHVQLPLELAGPVLDAAVGPTATPLLRGLLSDALGEDAMMVELAAIKTARGSEAQQLHSDSTPRRDRSDALLWTVFLPLQHTNASMGALHVCPTTHTCQPHFGKSEGDTSSWCDQHCETVTATLGDAVVMDSRTVFAIQSSIHPSISRALYYTQLSSRRFWIGL